MPTYLNGTGVPLSVAVYLATDHYDYDPGTISATALMKAPRQQILPARIPQQERTTDILTVVKSRIGTSIHDGLEKAWAGGHYVQAMKSLGYPEKVIDRVVINGDPDKMTKKDIPVYMEIRTSKEINGFTVSGKFDFVAEGRLEDFKSTSTYTWTNNTKDEDYQLQGSIYRWLNPKIITRDHMAIQFFFTDWMAGKAKSDKLYPQRQVEQKLIPLMDLSNTEDYIKHKLDLFQRYRDVNEAAIPLCDDKALWRKPPAWKYYKNPASTKRSTKNFDNAAEAYARLNTDGNVGIVIEVPGQVVACKYCNAFPVCTQKDMYLADGTLIID